MTRRLKDGYRHVKMIRFRIDPTLTQPAATFIPELSSLTTQVRLPNAELWSLLTRPGPLSAAEWAIIERYERAGEGAGT